MLSIAAMVISFFMYLTFSTHAQRHFLSAH